MKASLIALAIAAIAGPAAAQSGRPEIYSGPPRLIVGRPRPGQLPVLYGAGTPRGEIAYPLAPGHVQAPPDMRKAFPRGIPPAWLD